jgi:6-phosphogluconolactonase
MSVFDRASHIVIAADEAALAETAAARLVARIQTATGGARICLTGGRTPQALYRLLARSPWRERIAWHSTHWFVGDERFVPLADPLSNMGTAGALMLDRCAAPGTVHPIPTDAADPDRAARAYEATLQAVYGASQLDRERPLFDLVLMGVGGDGHTASLFPGAPALAEPARWTVGVEKAGLAPFVPRVTLTLPALNACREMLALVDGADKRPVLAKLAASDHLPAARLNPWGGLTWIVTTDAAPEALDAR